MHSRLFVDEFNKRTFKSAQKLHISNVNTSITDDKADDYQQ